MARIFGHNELPDETRTHPSGVPLLDAVLTHGELVLTMWKKEHHRILATTASNQEVRRGAVFWIRAAKNPKYSKEQDKKTLNSVTLKAQRTFLYEQERCLLKSAT